MSDGLIEGPCQLAKQLKYAGQWHEGVIYFLRGCIIQMPAVICVGMVLSDQWHGEDGVGGVGHVCVLQ